MELRELENERKFPKDLDVEYALVAAETDNKYLNKQDYSYADLLVVDKSLFYQKIS